MHSSNTSASVSVLAGAAIINISNWSSSGPTKHRNPQKHVTDSTNYHAKHAA